MANEVDGKIALVTGASRGIGRAIALGLAQAGAHVAVNFISRDIAVMLARNGYITGQTINVNGGWYMS